MAFEGSAIIIDSTMFSKSLIYIDSNVQGVLYTDYKAGDKVKKGDRLGHITNPFGVVI